MLFWNKIWQKTGCMSSGNLTLHVVESCEWHRVAGKGKGLERKYNISSDKFIAEWSAEDLKGQDMEYIEWAGEYQLFSRLNERLVVLKSIENVAS